MDKQISVLVIEDEKHVRVAVGYNLKLERFEVYLAENGLDGIKLAQKKKPKVILLDWMIPEMDGLQVLSELKGNKKTKDIPVFMLTAAVPLTGERATSTPTRFLPSRAIGLM